MFKKAITINITIGIVSCMLFIGISSGIYNKYTSAGFSSIISKQTDTNTYSFTLPLSDDIDDMTVELKCDKDIYDKLIIDENVAYSFEYRAAHFFGKTYAVLVSINTDEIIDNRRISYAYSVLDWALNNWGQDGGIAGIDINVIPAWEISQGNPSVIVAVIDSGVDTSCDILHNSILDDGFDFYNDDASVYDDYLYDYHGTYIATTIALVAPNVMILPVKFMESSVGAIEDAVEATRYAINHGATIINMSWNFEEYNDELYELIKDNPNVLFVNAAGNRNINFETEMLYPCSYGLENIITVMAIDNNGSIYDASGYGANHVDIAAPGVDIRVIFPEDDETIVSGTSVAAAFVSAAAALIISENNKLTSVEVKNIIISSAMKLDKLNNLCRAEGYLDIYACLEKTIQ
jgi:subtilisin family serine protease